MFTYQQRTGNLTRTGRCPNVGQSEINALCTTPGPTDQTWHITGFGVATPTGAGSAVVGSGVTISGLTTDFNGATRPSPPSRGAFEYIVSVLSRAKGIFAKGIRAQ